jgi:hypothetical protein
MQRRVNFLGQFPADSRNCCQLVNPGIGDSLQAAKTGNQCLAPLGSDAADLFQARTARSLATPRAMPGNGKAVCLVTDFLNQMQGGMFRGNCNGSRPSAKTSVSRPGLRAFALGDAEHRQVDRPSSASAAAAAMPTWPCRRRSGSASARRRRRSAAFRNGAGPPAGWLRSRHRAGISLMLKRRYSDLRMPFP